MALERRNVVLQAGTMAKLKEKASKMDHCWRVTASDLIRFALHEVYGLEFTSAHIYEDNLREQVKKLRLADKGGTP